MTVGKKISLVCGALVAQSVMVGVISIYCANRLNTATQVIVSDPMPGNVLAGRFNSGAKKILVWMNLHMQMEDKSRLADLERKIVERETQWRKDRQTYGRLISGAEDRRIADQLLADFDRLMQVWRTILPLSRDSRGKEAFAIFQTDAVPAVEALDKYANELIRFNEKKGERLAEDAARAASTCDFAIWALILGSVVSGGVLAFLVVRAINRTLKRAAAELTEGAVQVASAASQVSASSQSLAQGSSEQAASLEETSASSEQINAMARKNAEGSQLAVELMGQSRQMAMQANESLDQSVTAMDEINDQSGKISRIIKTIDAIAFQTNILALNAAVEAARAGEAGMGFAVVADEVRSLAQRCAQAAKDTAALIEESIAKSTGGKQKVDQVAVAIRALTGELVKTVTLVDDVSRGSREQATGVEQIGKAIGQMEQVTQQTAAHAEESAAASQELTAQSETLKGVVARLTAMVDGSGPSSGAVCRTRIPAAKPQAASRRAGPPTAGSASLHKATPRSTGRKPPAAAHTSSRDDLPLDGDFTGF